MFRFFNLGSILGVDIGTTSIKIAEIAGGSKPRLKNYGILSSREYLGRSNAAIQASNLKISEKETAELLKKLTDKAGFDSKEAVASIPSFSVFTTTLSVPKMSDLDTNKAMSFQAAQHIPLPVSEVEIEWLKVGEREEDGGETQDIFLICVPKEIIEKYRKIFSLAGLKLKALELESLSLARAFADESGARLIVDIGAFSTNILVSDAGFIKSNIYTDFAGVSMTRGIANGLGISLERAEDLKRQKGLKGAAGDYELSTLPQVYLDVIIKETAKMKDGFEKSGGRKIERLILTGAGAKLSGMEEYFSSQLGIGAEIGNSLSRLKCPAELDLLSKDLGPELAVAVGLGIKNI